MIEKPKLYVLALAVSALAILIIIAVNVPFMSLNVDESAPEGSEAFNAPNAS